MGKQKTFVIGDIHGQLAMLENLMAKIPWRPSKDTLVFLGDYVDRGPDSRGVVDYLLRLKTTSSKIICILGNHEKMLLDYLSGNNMELYIANGGGATLRAYGLDPYGLEPSVEKMPNDHMAFYASLKLYLELEDYYLLHAGLRPGVPIERQAVMDMTWIREPFISSPYDFGKKVIFSHTPFEEPFVMGNKIGIDTGAAYGMRLCCVELPSERFYFSNP